MNDPQLNGFRRDREEDSIPLFSIERIGMKGVPADPLGDKFLMMGFEAGWRSPALRVWEFPKT